MTRASRAVGTTTVASLIKKRKASTEDTHREAKAKKQKKQKHNQAEKQTEGARLITGSKSRRSVVKNLKFDKKAVKQKETIGSKRGRKQNKKTDQLKNSVKVLKQNISKGVKRRRKGEDSDERLQVLHSFHDHQDPGNPMKTETSEVLKRSVKQKKIGKEREELSHDHHQVHHHQVHHHHHNTQNHAHHHHGNGTHHHLNNDDHDQNDEHSIMDVHTWSSYYNTDEADNDHVNVVHECIEKHQKLLLGRDKKPLKIFVPLCGQSYDLLYLAKLGHEVVGVEFALPAVLNFFRINQIPVRIDKVPCISGNKGLLFSSADPSLNLTIYNCDFYDLRQPPHDGFDAVWDSGAMHSLPSDKLQKYTTHMKMFLHKGSRILVEFAFPSCSGYDATSNDLGRFFGDGYSVKDIGKMKTKGKFFLKYGIKGFHVFLIQKS